MNLIRTSLILGIVSEITNKKIKVNFKEVNTTVFGKKLPTQVGNFPGNIDQNELNVKVGDQIDLKLDLYYNHEGEFDKSCRRYDFKVIEIDEDYVITEEKSKQIKSRFARVELQNLDIKMGDIFTEISYISKHVDEEIDEFEKCPKCKQRIFTAKCSICEGTCYISTSEEQRYKDKTMPEKIHCWACGGIGINSSCGCDK